MVRVRVRVKVRVRVVRVRDRVRVTVRVRVRAWLAPFVAASIRDASAACARSRTCVGQL